MPNHTIDFTDRDVEVSIEDCLDALDSSIDSATIIVTGEQKLFLAAEFGSRFRFGETGESMSHEEVVEMAGKDPLDLRLGNTSVEIQTQKHFAPAR